MGHKNNKKKKTSAVIGEVPKQKRLASVPGWLKVVVIAGLALVVLGSVSWLVYDGFIKKTDPLAGNIDWSHISDENKKVNSATQLAAKGDMTASKAAFDVLIQQSDPKDKAAAWQVKGNVCASHKDYQCALQSYQEAIKLDGGSSAEYIQAGNFAYLMNQKDVANGYYQKAIDILKKSSSKNAQSDVKRLESIISGQTSQGSQN